MDVEWDLGVEFVGVFAAPGVVVPVDYCTAGWVFAVEEEGRAVVATPSVISGELVEEDVGHVGTYLDEVLMHLVFHDLVVDIDVHFLVLGEHLDEEVVGGEDCIDFAGPRVLIVGIAEPCGFVVSPFGGHVVLLLFRGHALG